MHPLGTPPDEQPWVDKAAELAARFATTAAAYDESAEVPAENLEALHASGLDQALLPVEFGGENLSYRAYGEIVRLLAAGCPSTACIWVMHVGAACGLVAMSAPDTARFYAEEYTAGKRFANALSEPSGGNLFLLPQQHALPVDGGFRLTGAKRFTSGCEIADHFLVNVLVDGVPTFFGAAADETIAYLPIGDTMGLRANGSRLVEFHGTVLRADRRCLPPKGHRPNRISSGLPFLSLGVADAAVAALIEHARTRAIPTTGESLSAMQWLRFDLADVHSRLDAAGMYANHMSWLADENDTAFDMATMRAKLLANQVALDAAQLALKAGGGSGYLSTSPIQRILRDAYAGWVMAYSAEVCRDRISAELLDG
ncbi:acyl-CoA dehydrogenase family protein [Kibdelosporangium phytohabitans]|uniref:Acyl-CoA dehydrogenase n=1 Tax=Kibdelosporangium phytohabitans TaxID=860235 RepID=A0A0N9I2C2_9PSEU|nr:acyl-CoA dehydrogenase family protein [Kibdelosporangium phytohabitans]ALG11804.1 acyl-CoA dehydrogenase [Kibdelosporangium phytohabitans]MBE1463215.1 alkylation response protein AidB-like acyl-CoA dehydrogenase [Kibdelosporangium phytohabitans]